MISATHTNITPAKLEEFEATFKHFDKDDTNVRPPPWLVADERHCRSWKCILLWRVWELYMR